MFGFFIQEGIIFAVQPQMSGLSDIKISIAQLVVRANRSSCAESAHKISASAVEKIYRNHSNNRRRASAHICSFILLYVSANKFWGEGLSVVSERVRRRISHFDVYWEIHVVFTSIFSTACA